jgi:hypothetical protein
MKRLFLILTTIGLLSFSSFSQGITLNYLNSGYTPGFNSTTYNADTTGILPGNAGPNIYWDFSALNVSPMPNVVNYMDPKTTPYSGQFPSATVAYTSGTTFHFYKINSSENSYLGWADEYETSPYSDLQINFTYPFKFGDELTDSFVSHTTGQIESFISGTTHIKADGWGTIKLPHNTYNNVLRVKYNIVSKDSSFVGVEISQTQTYLWYDGTHKTPILEITTIQGLLNGVPIPLIIKKVIVADFTNGIVDDLCKSSDFKIFPNPANKKTEISYDLITESDVVIDIYNLYGELIRNIKIGKESPGHYIENIPLADFQPGIYFIRLKRNGLIGNQKVIIE